MVFLRRFAQRLNKFTSRGRFQVHRRYLQGSAARYVSTNTAQQTIEENLLYEQPLPKVFFPWLHSVDHFNTRYIPICRKSLLNYFGGNSMHDNGKKNPQLISICAERVIDRFFRKMAEVEMGMPSSMMLSMFGTVDSNVWNHYERDFIRSFGIAVQGVVSDAFQIPMNNLGTDDGRLNIDICSDLNNKHFEVNRVSDIVRTDSLNMMVDEDLSALYRASSEYGSESMRVKLNMTPVAANIGSTFLVPILTRDHVRQNPELKNAISNKARNLQKEVQSGEVDFLDAIMQMNENLLNIHEITGFENKRTIVAEVSIRCYESFTVHGNDKDLVQGNGRERVVDHLVRFEMTTSEGDDGKRVHGSWKISDWDGLLGGNTWW